VKVLHRRRDALVTKLFFRVMRADMIRPVRRNPVTNRVPGYVFVIWDRKITVVDEPTQ
jgi:hypothetical protein